MVTQITLGNFGQVNGRTVLTGGASQLDTQAIIKALTDAKRLPADRLETKNETIDKKTSAFNELLASFRNFKSAVNVLRNPPGVGIDSQNIFQYRTSSLTSSLGLSASSYLEVTAIPGALAQSYTIDSITQLAQASKQQTGSFSLADSTTVSAVSAVPTAGLLTAGTVQLRAVDGTVGGISLTLDAGDSLEVVASKFNEISSRTGIQAGVVKEATGSYRLSFSATQTGTTYGFDFNVAAPGPGNAVENDPSGVFSSISFVAQTPTQIAQNSIFSLDGISITRESNAISDAISGLTFNLKQDGFAGTINAAIEPDTTLASNAITQFADAYNEFRLFAARQSELDENSQPTEDAVLYNNSTFRNIVSSVAIEVSAIIAGITGSDPARLSDVGITIEDFAGDTENPATQDILVVDPDMLVSALQSNFDGVRQLFEFQMSSDDISFVNFKRSNSLNGLTGFSMSIDRTTDTYQATYTDPTNGSVQTVSFDYEITGSGGVILTGQSGTIFDGSQFLYASTSSATVNVTLTQGFGDRFYNMIEQFITDADGLIPQEIEALAEDKSRNEEQIDKIDEQVLRYQDQLVTQYANLEAALTRANQLLMLLDAQSNANNNN